MNQGAAGGGERLEGCLGVWTVLLVAPGISRPCRLPGVDLNIGRVLAVCWGVGLGFSLVVSTSPPVKDNDPVWITPAWLPSAKGSRPFDVADGCVPLACSRSFPTHREAENPG
jgi:hypothetical protein